MDPILSSILGPVCQRLLDAAIEEYRLVRDVKEEIRNLRTTVSMIKGVLEDAERKKVENGAILIWLKSLKQVLFDAEDVFDEIATEALERDAEDGTTQSAVITRRLSKVRSKLVSCLCSVDHISTGRAIAHRVKDINKEFDHISKSKDSLGLIHVLNETSWPVFRITSSQLSSCDAHLVGRVDEMQNIEELLLKNSAEGTVATTSDNYKNVHVINVVGMGGHGKTTLVKHAYNSPAMTEYFHPRMWVCISNDFDVLRITIEIMDAVASSFKEPRDEFVNSLSLDVVQKCLQEKLEGKRFLLVLDDMWEENFSKWDSLCAPLMHGGKGSKIIVTTRKKTMSNITKGTPISLKGLPSEDLWTILQHYAFDGHDPDTHLEEVGRQIVQKLKGSPLAARTIGRVLNANLDVRHWTNILSSKAWVSSDSEGSILPILKLSYDHLSGHLKQCFALCSLFPEDHQFDKDELVQLWTAHQLIHVKSEGSVYLDKLVHTSLFEKFTNDDGQERFVMHDLTHNLADSVSKDDCLRLEDNQQNGTIPETIRHVSIASDKFDWPKIEQLCNKYRNMRTLLFLPGCKFQPEPHLDNIFIKLQRLRVLGLSGCGIKELPASIGALKHLRLLDLFDNRIRTLPESLCKLRNLQVLKLESCELLGALPPRTSAQLNLRQLITATVVVPKNLRQLITATVVVPKKIISLKTLEATSCSPKQIATWLRQVSSLQELSISRCHQLRCFGAGDDDAGPGDDDTTINAGDLDLDLEGALLDLAPSLRTLRLGYCENLSSLPSKLRSLTRLQTLRISSCPKIQCLPSAGLPQTLKRLFFPRLHTLVLYDCMKLRELPPLPLTLTTLELYKVGLTRLPGWILEGCSEDDIGRDDVVIMPASTSTSSSSPSRILSTLKIEGCPNITSLDDGDGLLQLPLPMLKELTIANCGELRSLLGGAADGLVSLKSLTIRNCPKFLHLVEGAAVIMPSTSTSSFPSLSILEILSCPSITSLDDGDGLLQRPLPMLKELKIKHCGELRSLGGVAGLVSLEELSIRNCPKLLHLVEEEGGAAAAAVIPSSSVIPVILPSSSPVVVVAKKIISLKTLEAASCSPKQIATWLRQVSSLQELKIWDCPQLRCFGAGDDDSINVGDLDLDLEGALLDLAPSLRELLIHNCENLSSLPSKLRSLTRLETLVIWSCPKIQRLPSAGLPETLKQLYINDCPNITSLGDGLRSLGGAAGLVSLEKLGISNCPKLLHLVEEEGGAAAAAVMSSPPVIIPSSSSSPVVVVPKKIISLKTLWASSCSPKQIATWLRQVSSLQELSIYDCPQLRCFGAGDEDDTTVNAGDLDLDLEGALLDLAPSLRKLYLFGCENLSSLPSKLRSLTRLETLSIWNCPELEERCREEGCPDWPLLSHIPHVQIQGYRR